MKLSLYLHKEFITAFSHKIEAFGIQIKTLREAVNVCEIWKMRFTYSYLLTVSVSSYTKVFYYKGPQVSNLQTLTTFEKVLTYTRTASFKFTNVDDIQKGLNLRTEF